MTPRKLVEPPPFESWANQWTVLGNSAVVQAAELHGLFQGFLESLETLRRSQTTIAMHTGHLWILGTEIMAFFQVSATNQARGIEWYFATCMPNGEGPAPKYLLKQKVELRAYQGTCQQLVKYIRGRKMAGLPIH